MQDMINEPQRFNEGKVDWTLLPWNKEQFWDLQEDFHNCTFTSQKQVEYSLINWLIEKNVEKCLVCCIYILGKDYASEGMYFNALEQVCRVFEYGAAKYGRENYQLSPGLPLDNYIQSMWRHTVEYLKGVEFDEESQLPHLAHLACNCFMYLWTVKNYGSSPPVNSIQDSQTKKEYRNG